MEQERFADAVGSFARSRQYEDSAAAAFYHAFALQRSGQPDLAIEAYLRASQELGDNVNLLNNLGFAYFMVGFSGEALLALEKAISINPEDKSTLLNYGIVNFKLERYAKAVEAWDKTISLDPNMSEAPLTIDEVTPTAPLRGGKNNLYVFFCICYALAMSIRKAVKDRPAYNFQAKPHQIKLDQNESPYDLSPELKEKVFEKLRATAFNRYPDIHADGVRAAIADYCDWPELGIAVGSGSNTLIRRMIEISGLGQTVLCVKPTFAVYELDANLLEPDALIELELADDFSLPAHPKE